MLIRVRRLTFMIAATTVAAMCWNAHADTVTLEPVKDNSLIEDVDGALSNAISDGVFSGKTGPFFDNRLLRALLAFDVQGSVPAGSTVNSVSLTMYSVMSISDAQTHTLHKVLGDWGEGTSGNSGGGGTPSTRGDATWIHRFYPDVFWSNAGGDFVASPSASASIAMANETPTWSAPEMVADVQAWVNNPATNFGWMIIGNEIDLTTAKKLASREWLEPTQRPKLTIDFTPAPKCPADIAPQPDGDGNVNLQDLLFVIANWGQGAGNPADINGSGTVNLADLLLVIGNWGTC